LSLKGVVFNMYAAFVSKLLHRLRFFKRFSKGHKVKEQWNSTWASPISKAACGIDRGVEIPFCLPQRCSISVGAVQWELCFLAQLGPKV